jgi:hypothetical protein
MPLVFFFFVLSDPGTHICSGLSLVQNTSTVIQFPYTQNEPPFDHRTKDALRDRRTSSVLCLLCLSLVRWSISSSIIRCSRRRSAFPSACRKLMMSRLVVIVVAAQMKLSRNR